MPACYRIFTLLIAVGLTASGLSSTSLPQEDADDSPYLPGLIATYSASGTTAVRADEIVAFDWQNAAADPRLPASEFTATWRGRLWARGAGTYRLACYIQGEVELKLDGKTVISGRADQPQWLHSQPLELEFDYHPLEITFHRSQPSGQLALFWSGPDFRLEPIPARAFVHDRAQSPSTSFERGRQLAAALRCGACHQDNSASITPAPALDRLTGNIHEHWLVNWLAAAGNEPSLKVANVNEPLRRMPHLPMNPNEAAAVAAWLLREPAPNTEPQKNEQKEIKATKSESKKTSDGKSSKKSKGEEKPKPSAPEGERLLLTRGCLACHQFGSLGESGLFGGGDLTSHLSKRPVGFLTRWLQDPTAINRSHRMPVFTFTADEHESLKLWEDEKWKLVSPGRSTTDDAAIRRSLIQQGERLVTTFQCGNCHVLSRTASDLAPAKQPSLTAASNWSRSCTGQPDRGRNRPGYLLQQPDQDALKAYYSESRPGESHFSLQSRGRDLLTQLNCLACHQREGATSVVGTVSVPSLPNDAAPSAHLTLQEKLTAVADSHPDLAPLIPAMTPPALNSVGDKLHDTALADSISRQGPPHRPYLLVQMPKFNLTKDQLADLTAYFTSTDRIPPTINLASAPSIPNPKSQIPNSSTLAAAGPRLVTTDGLACTSCHQVGSVLPSKAPLNARGPDMSMLGQRIRREWFDRWCENPARIVPRMEMPAVKIPVRGVLSEKIDDQLAAVWHILNTPGFEPPEPNPVRVLRLSGVPEKNERPIVIHDVFKDGDKTYLYPLVIGLPNRHNILFDLETNRLAAWWLGDTARQRTKGKSWFWEMGGKSIFDPGFNESEISVWINSNERFPEATNQFKSELSAYTTANMLPRTDDSIGRQAESNFTIERRIPTTAVPISSGGESIKIGGIDTIREYSAKSGLGSGFTRILYFVGYGEVNGVNVRVVSQQVAQAGKWDENSRTFRLPSPIEASIRLAAPQQITWNGDGTISAFDQGAPKEKSSEGFSRLNQEPGLPTWRVRFEIDYFTSLPTDRHLAEPAPNPHVQPSHLNIAPGFTAQRLPLSPEIMPSALTWFHSGELVFTTLKGEIFRAEDSDGDGVEDTSQLVADGLATPYGIHAGVQRTLLGRDEPFVDVAAKDGLLRVPMADRDSVHFVESIASGWGHTDDYHDWAVGPIPGNGGELFLALPCQQDQRSDPAAAYRGRVIKLVPRKPTRDNSRLFDIEVISAGHRFPMGMARNREGELFVTDNQGNYNPFNELNHVKKGAHFGFINALEKQNGFVPPPLTEPAINIPHPWTRSVNGICFLDTPLPSGEGGSRSEPGEGLQDSAPRKSLYGPFEGHLVGCEYDTRRLIRMSLQKIGDTYQGCAYPLSIPPDDVEKGLLGPIVCAIKPTTGELYVGEIRDSGWGASNNIGQIVKIQVEPEKLPCGIAEVRATSAGFTVDFIQPVDPAKAADVASYSIQSYRRESTPAYGGPDLDRRDEKIESVTLSPDAKRAMLTLPNLRPGFVYEIQLKNLAHAGAMFHPDQAHYTLRQIPN